MPRPLICLALLLTISACAPTSPAPAGTSSGPRPYPTASPAATDSPLPPLTEVFLPTPTPIMYTVIQGDTLSGIALRYQVSLEALIAANPGVQATLLLVGTRLTIPPAEGASGEPTPTAVPLAVRQARCWPGGEGGWWCFALLQNDYAEAVEDLSAQFTLFNPNGRAVTSQVAFAPLDILPPGRSMPIAVFFPPPVAADRAPSVQILTSIRLTSDDPRYLPAFLEHSLTSVDWSGLTAEVSGKVRLGTPSGTAHTLWVLAVAYDAAGEVVGLRRWEAPTPLAAGQDLAFQFPITSVGPAIERVDLLVEARP